MCECVGAKSLWSCPTLCDPMDCSPSGSSVHGILQTRILEWVASPSPGDLPDPRTKPASLMPLALAGGFFTTSTTCEAPITQQYLLNEFFKFSYFIKAKYFFIADLNFLTFTWDISFPLSSGSNLYLPTLLRKEAFFFLMYQIPGPAKTMVFTIKS